MSKKAPSPAGYAVDLSPKGEVKSAVAVAQRHLSLWGRGRPKGRVRGPSLLGSETMSAALPSPLEGEGGFDCVQQAKPGEGSSPQAQSQ
jgi:hypothetical protein